MSTTVQKSDRLIFPDSFRFKEIRQWSDKSFKDHQITVLTDTPEFKKFKYSQPDRWCHGFYLIHASGLTFMQGDLDFGAWNRTFDQLRDIFNRDDEYQIEKYWLREIPNKEFSYEKTEQSVLWEIQQAREEENNELAEQWEDVLHEVKISYEEGPLLEHIYSVCNGNDFINVKDFTPAFCWNVLGMKSFFNKYNLI